MKASLPHGSLLPWVAVEIANLDHGGDRKTDQAANLRLDEPSASGGFQADAAKLLDVSERSVRAAVVVRDHGVPELKEKLEAGRVSVSAAEVIAKQPKPEQEDIAALDERRLSNGWCALESCVLSIAGSLPLG